MIPLASEEQLLLVELVRSVSAMRTETVIQTVKEVLKQPPAIAKDKVGVYFEMRFSSSWPTLLQWLRAFLNVLQFKMTLALRSFSNLTETPVTGGLYAAVLLRLCPAVRFLLPNYSTCWYLVWWYYFWYNLLFFLESLCPVWLIAGHLCLHCWKTRCL